MPRDGRMRAIEYYEKKIRDHLTALDIIRSIPTNKILHITTQQCLLKNFNSYSRIGYKVGGKIVIPRKWNGDSLRCNVLAVEHVSYDAKNLLDRLVQNPTAMSPIRFMDILSWKEFDRKDAGLYVNWAAITPDFKKIAFEM